MDGGTVALVISGLALAVSIVGTALADRRSKASERLAIEARDDARAARTDALSVNLPRVFRFDKARSAPAKLSQGMTETGVRTSGRPPSRADALWRSRSTSAALHCQPEAV